MRRLWPAFASDIFQNRLSCSFLSRRQSMRNIIAMALISTLLIGGAAALASERKIAMKDLPPAVQQAIKDQGGAKVRGLAKEVEQGKTLYEAELTVNGHSKDVTFDAQGQVVSVEEQTPIADIPSAAREAIQKA